jgi:hypothetical protein
MVLSGMSIVPFKALGFDGVVCPWTLWRRRGKGKNKFHPNGPVLGLKLPELTLLSRKVG